MRDEQLSSTSCHRSLVFLIAFRIPKVGEVERHWAGAGPSGARGVWGHAATRTTEFGGFPQASGSRAGKGGRALRGPHRGPAFPFRTRPLQLGSASWTAVWTGEENPAHPRGKRGAGLTSATEPRGN